MHHACRVASRHVLSRRVISRHVISSHAMEKAGRFTIPGRSMACLRFALVAALAAGPRFLALARVTISDEALLQFSCRVGSGYRLEDTKPRALPPKLPRWR